MSFFKDQFEKNKKQVIMAGVVLVVILLVGVWLYYRDKKAHTYYAVFLTNSQVYFGNVSDWDDDYVRVSNAFYLQSPNPEEPKQVQLIRRGAELHNPTGEMKINRSQILFIEKLSPASPVAKNIEQALSP